MQEYQLYDEQGQPIGQASSDRVFQEGLLHGASHVWIWRILNGKVEVLLQKRAPQKQTWPNRLDISAAGHIDADESPLNAAIRELNEELGIPASGQDLMLVAVKRQYAISKPNNIVENEFCWLYVLRLDGEMNFTIEKEEVESLQWVEVKKIRGEIAKDKNGDKYVPLGSNYFNLVFDAIEEKAS